MDFDSAASEIDELGRTLQTAYHERDEARAERDAARRQLAEQENFGGHYFDWRLKRLQAIIGHYGPAWFQNKRVLELACGYGDIGVALMMLGSDVTFSDARPEHLETVSQRYPSIPADKLVSCDLDHGISGVAGPFDLILHMGVLYHLDDWQQSLRDVAGLSSAMVLETEVVDAVSNEFEVKSHEDAPDHAVGGVATHPSESYVERILDQVGFRYDKIMDGRCNSSFHVYDWPLTDSGTWCWGQRRFWFCEKTRSEDGPIDCQLS